MLNFAQLRQTYLRVLGELGLSAEQVPLSAGGALVALGCRETTADLDLDVPRDTFQALLATGRYATRSLTSPVGDVIVIDFSDEVEIFEAVGAATQMIDGICVYSTNALVEQKVRLYRKASRSAEKRQQDLMDLLALRKLLRQDS